MIRQPCGCLCVARMVGLAPKWVRLAPNGTNPGLFQIRFQCIWRPAQNALKSDLKKPGICPILANLTHFGAKPTIPEGNYVRVDHE